ncbi:MAG: FecR domain-containing protein [Chitinophagaceae bacterium]|nr:FecR domain-containing protein [Chitinophagaceae bacterium]
MKENPHDHSHDLLVKYLLDEATSEEVTEIEQWLRNSENNRIYYNQLKTIWEESRQLAPEAAVNEEAAWQRFNDKKAAVRTEATVVNMAVKRKNWIRVAAILLLVAGVGSYLFFNRLGITTASSGDAVATHTLPDGSQVVLNKNASISWPRSFGTKSRTVVLTGEAFFKVVPDAQKPFIIEVGEVSVEVVGTSFNIKNTDVQTEIIVETGIVNVSSAKSSVQLKQNEKAVVLKNKGIPEKIPVKNQLYNYYRTNLFVCNETPLPELVAILNDAYKAKITIGSRRAAELRLTTTFENKSLEQMLEVIRETLNIRIEKANGAIIIK